MGAQDVQYTSDEQGDLRAAIVPIARWREIVSELETHYLLKTEAVKKRLPQARRRDEGIPFEEVLGRLGIE